MFGYRAKAELLRPFAFKEVDYKPIVEKFSKTEFWLNWTNSFSPMESSSDLQCFTVSIQPFELGKIGRTEKLPWFFPGIESTHWESMHAL